MTNSKPKAIDPSHYQSLNPEPVTVIEDWSLPYHLGVSLSYIARADLKGSREDDLKKAANHTWRAATGRWLSEDFVAANQAPVDEPTQIRSELSDNDPLLDAVLYILQRDYSLRPDGFASAMSVIKLRIAFEPYIHDDVVRDSILPYDIAIMLRDATKPNSGAD